MNELDSINYELYKSFKDITYFDEPHKYFVNGKPFVSVTTLLHQYSDSFDEEYWLNRKSEELNIPKYQIKRAWNFINVKGTMKGSLIHDYAENRLLNKVFRYPESDIIDEFGFDPVSVEYDITKKHADSFIKASKDKLIPVKTELVVYDEESLIAGMADLLYYNVRENEYQIWDWKTNKKFTKKTDYYLKGLFNALDNSDLEVYSLQLETYKYIIEKNTNIKLGKSYLVWLSHNNDDFEIIPTKDRRVYVDQMFNKRIADLVA